MQEPHENRGATILVTGATGHLGTAVIRQLLRKVPAKQIAAFVRDERKASALKEKGADVRLGNLGDRASLDKVMDGIEQVLLISGTDEENGLQQHKNVVDAAKMAKVRSIAYTGRSLKDRSRLENKLMERHFQTEDYIQESGLAYILFRNALYMDTVPTFVGEKVFETGIRFPAGAGRVAYALRSEQGEAMANALAEGVDDNRIYRLTGSESWSFDDVAAALSDLSGKEVSYTPVERSAFEAQMKQRGVPDPVVGKIVGFLTDIKNGQEEEVAPDLETLLGRKPTSLREGLRTLFHL